MIHAELVKPEGILILTPDTALTEEDFQSVAAIVDPYIEEQGKLKGILIQADRFPGWHDFGALVSHIKFVREHHKHVSKVAAVSDSRFLEIAPHIAGHFVNAEVKHFPADQLEQAKEWLQTAG